MLHSLFSVHVDEKLNAHKLEPNINSTTTTDLCQNLLKKLLTISLYRN